MYVEDFFELNKVAKWAEDNCLKLVALQLPDEHLKFAFKISQYLEEKCKETKFYVLADTSFQRFYYEHGNCDSIVHFGESCFSTVTELPVLHIFCRSEQVNIEAIKSELEQAERNGTLFYGADSSSTLEIIYDCCFHHSADDIYEEISKIRGSNNTLMHSIETSGCQNSSTSSILGRKIDEATSSSDVSNNILLFIGAKSSRLLPIWLLSFNNRYHKIFHYVSELEKLEIFDPPSSKNLMRRFYLVEKIKEASVIGLVIGTVAVKSYQKAITRVRNLCKNSKKKLYVFYIGKINEAKLSNFAADVDSFILLSCPFGIILNFSDFYKPIVSLYEAELALNPLKTWSSMNRWTSQFWEFLDDEMLEQKTEKTIGDVDAVQCSSKANQLLEYSIGGYFDKRSWIGLQDENLSLVVDNHLKTGLTGIAIGYSTEPS